MSDGSHRAPHTAHLLRAAFAPALACGLVLLTLTRPPDAGRTAVPEPDSPAWLAGAAVSNASAASYFAARRHSEVNNWSGTHFGMDFPAACPSSYASFSASRTNL